MEMESPTVAWWEASARIWRRGRDKRGAIRRKTCYHSPMAYIVIPLNGLAVSLSAFRLKASAGGDRRINGFVVRMFAQAYRVSLSVASLDVGKREGWGFVSGLRWRLHTVQE